MYEDPIIREIRKIRNDIEADCQNDPQKYYEHILQVQKTCLNRLVRFEPKRALKLVRP
ncbi:hypothetical protein MCHI_000854 [Candidatus Magnetoovum chiemensis]|nr:hypothetical protein MCHI_000854 [Candidatus Magnetoovum chiemensis]